MTLKIEWYSGTGKGGQHRNKHQNCCRLTHVETGLMANGTRNKSRAANKRDALNVLKSRVFAHLHKDKARNLAGSERVRTYHEPDNRVVDHASKLVLPYKQILNDISPMVDARRMSVNK